MLRNEYGSRPRGPYERLPEEIKKVLSREAYEKGLADERALLAELIEKSKKDSNPKV